MTLADKFTSLRLILGPAFFIVYFLPGLASSFFTMQPSMVIPVNLAWTVPILWTLFLVCEITDMLDGMLARKRAEVSDFGKLYDPFADTLAQLSFFLCFTIDKILPPILFLVVLYREFSILFVRNLMLRKGIIQGARLSGKVKTVSYIFTGVLALLVSSAMRLNYKGNIYLWSVTAAKVVFCLSVIIALLSFVDYLYLYFKASQN
jgi:CDP-diacylglycerol--glycerol-3-phosphate 3-phosphatidyltransferase